MTRRLPGQSIRDQKDRLTDEEFVPHFFTPIFFWIVFVVELFHRLTNQGPHPALAFVCAVIVTAVSIVGFFRLIPRMRNLNRGERGEVEVGGALEELRAIGYRPIHDIVGKGFNIDHVLVGPAGVFAIETKFRSGSGLIEFRNGEGLFVDGRAEEKDCFSQATGNAAEVRKLIREHCGINPWVKALVVFVGDWRVKNNWRDTDIRVLTPDKIVAYIRELQPELKRSEIQLIASHLDRTAKS